MGPYAKTMILLLLLVYLDPFIGIAKGLENGANSATNEDMVQVKMIRKLLTLEVDVQRDYPPAKPNPKNEPGPPKGKSGTSAGGGT
ncbi:hypothetical protein PTKIN_Ptkin05aG0074700 [Pterospermum kingtungense]